MDEILKEKVSKLRNKNLRIMLRNAKDIKDSNQSESLNLELNCWEFMNKKLAIGIKKTSWIVNLVKMYIKLKSNNRSPIPGRKSISRSLMNSWIDFIANRELRNKIVLIEITSFVFALMNFIDRKIIDKVKRSKIVNLRSFHCFNCLSFCCLKTP